MANRLLSNPEKSALLALMAISQEVSNTDLKLRYGTAIDGKVRTNLVADGYITSRKIGRALAHELTETGWRWCREHLTDPIPSRFPRGDRLLGLVLSSVGQYLDRNNLALADVFDEGVSKGEPMDAEGRIRNVYDELARSPGAWINLARLRAKLPELSRSEVDVALLGLHLKPHVFLVPESNQSALTPDERAAAIRIGGEDKHLLSIESR